MLLEFKMNIDSMIEVVFNDDEWIPKNNNNVDRFSNRLNYVLTEDLQNFIDIEKHYVIRKFSLHHNLLENE